MKDHPSEPRIPPKQRSVRLPDATYRELKARSAFEGLTLTEVVEELVRVYLAGKMNVRDKGQKKDRDG